MALLAMTALLSDILVGRDPAATSRRAVGDGDDAALNLDHVVEDLALDHTTFGGRDVLVDVLEKSSCRRPIFQQVTQRASLICLATRQPVHFKVALVANNQ